MILVRFVEAGQRQHYWRWDPMIGWIDAENINKGDVMFLLETCDNGSMNEMLTQFRIRRVFRNSIIGPHPIYEMV